MRSKWYESKQRALHLRRRGVSIVVIESHLKIPRSTLSGWFRGIRLTDRQKQRLDQNKTRALQRARKKASAWHREQKRMRLEQAHAEAGAAMHALEGMGSHVLELALALLYLGEGSKRTVETAMGNSDPMVLRFFLTALQKLYNLDIRSIRCELTLRADQDPERMKRYWANVLRVPMSCFRHVRLDQRTAGSATYANYRGVCYLRCGHVAIQRELLSLAEQFCKRTIQSEK